MVSFEIADKIRQMRMSKEDALKILGGNLPVWELKRIKKALSRTPLLNTYKEELRLKAVNVLLKAKQKHKRATK